MPKKKKITKEKRAKKQVDKKKRILEKEQTEKKKQSSFFSSLSEKKTTLFANLGNWKTISLVLIVLILIVIDGFLYLKSNGQSNNKIISKPKTSSGQGTAIPKDEPTSPEYTSSEQAPILQEEIDKWQTYSDSNYNFSLKFPEDWPKPQTEKLVGQNYNYQYKISFSENFSNDKARGFEIFIYNPPEKTSFLNPKYSVNLVLKDPVSFKAESCKNYDDASIGTESYPAKEIYILKDDPCYKETYFFRLLNGSYVYDIVPVLENSSGYQNYDGEKEVKNSFKEFYYILSTLKLNTTPAVEKKIVPKIVTSPIIKRPAPKRILLTCGEKHDKPHKSRQHKGKHIDEDCCPDPDEWPNPACAYSSGGYKMMIKR